MSPIGTKQTRESLATVATTTEPVTEPIPIVDDSRRPQSMVNVKHEECNTGVQPGREEKTSVKSASQLHDLYNDTPSARRTPRGHCSRTTSARQCPPDCVSIRREALAMHAAQNAGWAVLSLHDA